MTPVLAIFQPDIAQNLGTMLRLCACLGVPVAIIEPAAFPVSDRAFRRAGLDYLEKVAIERHISFEAFETWRAQEGRRLVLITTAGSERYERFSFAASDVLMVGRESAGVPERVHAAAGARVRVPLRPGLRSLNVAVCAGMVLGEALRQTGTLPLD